MILHNLDKTQKSVSLELIEAVEKNFLPQSILFSGPSGSSRLTAALDLSFHLTGEDEKRSTLSSSQIIFFPSRNLVSQKDAAISLFDRQRTKASRLFLLETVRTILFQYHPALISAYSSSISSYFASAEEIGRAIMEFEEDREYTEKEIKALLKLLKDKLTSQFIMKGRRTQTVSIDEIRAVQKYFSTGQDEKVVIIENLEESNEGAKNSLLKLLEEPNEHSHIILISSNPQRLLQTILSRVRKFTFPALSDKQVTKLLSERFSLYRGYDSFESFFFEEGTGEEERKRLVDSASKFASILYSGKVMDREDEEDLLMLIESSSYFRYFRNRVADNLRKMLMEGGNALKIRRLTDIMNKWSGASDIYNLSQRVALDSILREAQNVK